VQATAAFAMARGDLSETFVNFLQARQNQQQQAA
jgi:hypothetical protein